MLKRVGAQLFGALPGGAVGIEANVGIEVVEQRGVVFLLQMDDRQQTVDHRLLRGSRARLFRGRESGFEMPARTFAFPLCVESWP